MINRVNPNNADEQPQFSEYSPKIVQPVARDRYMMTLQPYYKPSGAIQPGLKPYDPGYLPMINTGFGGRFAIADLPKIQLPPPWERIQK